ncbi:MAG TPA: cell envelope integrity protein CreD [Chryseolinea sp.]|nr:cell envelope integrity protein CreD [Chryseolinea sp.]HPM29514.1 cell envelope integrity protein CreD [Chryseolinea sp.]
METTQPVLNIFERLNQWIKESIMIKLISIGFLILILLIPSAAIKDLIDERQQRSEEVIREVTDKWSGSQTLTGPVLVIPYIKQEIIDRGKDGTEIREHIEKAFFLPEDLSIAGDVKPETRHRGIFDVVVYESGLQIKSEFQQPDFKALSIPEETVQWKDAYMIFGITDLRGISDNPTFLVGGKPFNTEPSNNLGIASRNYEDEAAVLYSENVKTNSPYSSNGIMTKLNWENKDSFKKEVSITLNLKGSKRLDFVPAGKTTTVKLSSTWNNPSFDGEFLPDPSEITEAGFTASWKVLHYNRPFSQQWKGNEQTLSGSEFGMKLLPPVDQYQKSSRTSKYAALIILLTFVSLFLVEITQKIRIHPFQYILIGAALIIYYSLLLSFSEHLGYDISYIISSLATVILIGLYSTTFLRTRKLSFLFSTLLVIFYAFIFVIILQQDYSLLLGSIGLFLIIGLVMYFSRKINWYKEAEPSQVN